MVTKTKRIQRSESSPPAKPTAARHSAHPLPSPSPLRWSVEQRLAFIEERLFWVGEVNRTDLVRRFGVSMSQASGDIGRYLALEPAGVSYDKSAKRYVAGEDFRPVLGAPDAKQFLGELRLVDAGILAAEDTMLGVLPPFDATPVPERAIDPLVLRAVLRAIRERRALDVLYQSMSRPKPLRRAIEPHALAHDGFRWHARSFDRESGEFRDFVLGRVMRAKIGEPAQSRPHDDKDWMSFVPLVIAPHPGLTEAQARAIAIDYGIRSGRGSRRAATAAPLTPGAGLKPAPTTTIRVRRALLFYALKRLGLDLAPGARPPHEQHIVLVNRDEVRAAMRRGEEV